MHSSAVPSESLFRIAFESSAAPMVVVENDMTISLVNASFEKISGYAKSEIECQMPWTAFIAGEELPRLERYHRIRRITPDAAPASYESRFCGRDGNTHEIALYVSLIPDTKQSVIAFHDITQRRQMEAELQKAQQLESLAQMANGIAHDFNNALTIILSSVSLARQYAAGQSDAVAKLREAEKEILRAKGLTSQLLTFSRGGEPALKTTQIGGIVRDTVRFALLGSPVIPELRIPETTWQCRIDTAQIAQVISSISLNARQAMPEGGSVAITVENIRLERRLHQYLPSGPYVLITISDNGCGIATEHLPRVFDPFFTTKKNGSGLGLSSSYTIMRKHQGHIQLVSEPNIGTTVYIYLPALTDELSDNLQQEAGVAKNILLAEEDAAIREETAALLREFGYQVDTVASGTDAVQKYQDALETTTPFHAVILDLSPIGRAGGRGCLRRLIDTDPLVRVIGGSRYAESFDLAEYRTYGFAHVAQKPYNIEQLIEIVEQVTDNKT